MSEKDVSLKIKSVKVMEATEKIKVVYKDTSNNKDDELTGIYSDKASPEFYTTMEKLNAIAAGICQFTGEYVKKIACIRRNVPLQQRRHNGRNASLQNGTSGHGAGTCI